MPLPQRWNFALGRHNRRSFLKTVGRAGLAAASVVPPAALLVAAQSRRADAGGQPLVRPQEIRSANGVLRTTITAAPERVQLGDFLFSGLLYNGAYLPPLLRPRLGDTMRITFRNALPDNRSDLLICGATRSDNTSNLHFHGMAVSPIIEARPN
jgi:FtsP/CotA-like multicopper oxidase with cupredoxin domain